MNEQVYSSLKDLQNGLHKCICGSAPQICCSVDAEEWHVRCVFDTQGNYRRCLTTPVFKDSQHAVDFWTHMINGIVNQGYSLENLVTYTRKDGAVFY
jgi:hypothetical protein